MSGRLVHLCRKDVAGFNDGFCIELEENPAGSGDYEAQIDGDDYAKIYPEYVLYINQLMTTKEIKLFLENLDEIDSVIKRVEDISKNGSNNEVT
jgi:hypothetical protein